MKLKLITIFIFCLNTASLYSQNYQKLLLYDIINNFDQYNNKTIILKLKLKNIDNIFNKIVFYDRKNIDIVFDISILKKTMKFQKRLLNIRPGLEYIVEFTVKDVIEETGFISGELIDFQPGIIFKLPEGIKSQKAE